MINENYVLILESKVEDPLVMEQLLRGSSYEKIFRRFQEAKQNPNVIRACIAKLVYETGNKNLLLGVKHED